MKPTPQVHRVPLQALNNHIAVLGKTGSGKTFTAKGMAEELLDAKQHLCIIDPTDVWWGMRSKYPVVVFGGRKGDFPLPANSGALMAEIVAKHEINVILSTKLMTVRERTQWFTDFAETLMRLNTEKLHLFIDEAHNFMPQGKVISPQAGMMLAAGNELLSGGRAQGLCIVMISQRAAKLHKDSLTQAESLVVMRLIAPQDRKAIMEWMGEWVENPEQAADLLKGMPSLRTGEGWFWAPEQGILRKGFFPRIKSFDSSAAPKKGGQAKVTLAKIDMKAVQAKLGAAAEEVKKNDPKELHAEIQRLKVELKKAQAAKPAPTVDAKALDRALNQGHEEGRQAMLQELTSAINAAADRMDTCRAAAGLGAQELRAALKGVSKKVFAFPSRKELLKMPVPQAAAALKSEPYPVGSLAYIGAPRKPPRPAAQAPKTGQAGGAAALPQSPPVHRGAGNAALGKAERAILTVLAQAGGEPRNKKYVALRAGYSLKGGGFNNALGRLNSTGYIERRGDILRILADGEDALGAYDPLPTGKELQEHWLRQLGKAEALILGNLCEHYPEERSKEQVAADTGYEAKGGGFNNAIGRLRTLELIEGSKDALKASAELI